MRLIERHPTDKAKAMVHPLVVVLTVITLQRHFRVLTKFAHVESQLSGRKRQREGVFYAPVNLCDRRACSASVAVGIIGDATRLFSLGHLREQKSMIPLFDTQNIAHVMRV